MYFVIATESWLTQPGALKYIGWLKARSKVLYSKVLMNRDVAVHVTTAT